MARRRKRAQLMRVANVDATPERLAKGDLSEFVNPAKIDSSEQPIGHVRRFRASYLDRLLRSETITWRQWYPANFYRETWERARLESKVVASYGERTTGGENSYGLAKTDAAARARKQLRLMRSIVPADMIGYFDRLVLHNRMPSLRNREGRRTLAQLKGSLDILAGWFFNDCGVENGGAF